MKRFISIHAHFYQPPRENPWLKVIEQQDSAYPYHDWNERITAESYAPNASARILDSERRIIEIVNNYSKISFNFGPTLLSWMEISVPDVYQKIIHADRESQSRFSGHGSAIAQAYNHVIMPLANSRDKRTQVIWGIRDFERRFGRYPEGMWLPETAVDIETLEMLSEHGIKFTILAPHQARRVRKIGDQKWTELNGEKIDPRRSYKFSLPSGRDIALFFYDGPISQDVAFGGLLRNGERFAKRLTDVFVNDVRSNQIVNIATDGETYGHHHRFGDMALSYCLYHIESNKLAEITIYGEYLEKNPPECEVEIVENTSWSCVHGVERWRSNCGCKLGTNPDWDQEWRKDLRNAMDWLRDAIIPVYESHASGLFNDIWRARDDYIDVLLDRSEANIEKFLSAHAQRELNKEEKVKALKLLEMQYHAMLMYTSCGWFFDEISGIEAVQVIKYAARAIQLAEELSGQNYEAGYVGILGQAKSNIAEFSDGAKIYNSFIKPDIIDLARVGAHYAISSLFERHTESTKMYCYSVSSENYDILESGKHSLAFGRARIKSDITWEEETFNFAVLHLGDHNFIGGVTKFSDEDSFKNMAKDIRNAFYRSNIAEIIHMMDEHFGSHKYSLWHLFKDEQRRILNQILGETLRDVEAAYRQIHENNYAIMRVMKLRYIALPKVLVAAAEFIINLDLHKRLEADELDLIQLRKLADEVTKLSFDIDRPSLGLVGSRRITKLMEELSRSPENYSLFFILESLMLILSDLQLNLDLWKAQNIYYSIGKQHYNEDVRARARAGDENAKKWEEHFIDLGEHLYVRVK
jgi:alpha-amylase/alpha-mannosidase (GH57 family)